MSNSVRAFPETIRTLAGANWAVYTALGTPFIHPIRICKVVNTTDALVSISFGGINDHDIVPSNSFFLYDVSSNKTANSNDWVFAAGTQIYIKGVATTGSVYLVAYYGQS